MEFSLNSILQTVILFGRLQRQLSEDSVYWTITFNKFLGNIREKTHLEGNNSSFMKYVFNF